jgi:chorismate-pyruvate lyase
MNSTLYAIKVLRTAIFLVAIAGAHRSWSASTEMAASVRALDADLLTHDSATEVLGRWCATHHLADPPVIRALRDTSVDKPAGHRVRALLKLGPDEPVLYRRVKLVCGPHVLSNADNWYVPDRLTDSMNRQLTQSETPFGLVVKPLGFHRVRLADSRLVDHTGTPAVDDAVLRHEALLVAGSGEPFSLVVESYTRDILTVIPSGR